MRISDWSSDVCSSDLPAHPADRTGEPRWRSAGGPHGRLELTGQPTAAAAGAASARAGLSDRAGLAMLVFEVTRAICPRMWSGPEATSRSEEHTSDLQSLMRISYAGFCLKKTNHQK